MIGSPIEILREFLRNLINELKNDPLSHEIVYLSIITFADTAQQILPLTEIRSIHEINLYAYGTTSFGAALRLLIDCIDKEVLKPTNIYRGDFKPIIFIMTDGQPTDRWQEAAEELKKRLIDVISCAIGPEADLVVLKAISNRVVSLKNLSPGTLSGFRSWLSFCSCSIKAIKEPDELLSYLEEDDIIGLDDDYCRPDAVSALHVVRGKKGGVSFRPLLFSAFYPEKVGSKDIGKIIAYAHLESLAREITREAAMRLDLPRDIKMKIKSEKPDRPVPRESVIKVTPEVPGLVFDKNEDTMTLWEDKQSVEFRFKPHPDSYGRSCHGFLHFWLEGLSLAAVPVNIFVAEEEVPEIFREALAKANAKPYRYVFTSYSHKDERIVDLIEAYAKSLGDVYLRDVIALRTGQRWQEELRQFIKKADVFQLFWSENAAASDYVREEWRQAIEERKVRPDPYFVRPVYWTEKAEPPPIPTELQEIHFVRLPYVIPR